MGSMLINILAFAVIQGLNGSLETLVSQSYGAKKFRLCGVYLNTGKIVATCTMIPVSIIYLFSDKILVALGQDPTVAMIAKHYCCVLIPGIWAQMMFDATLKFLSCQFLVIGPLYI